jgi:hypothetical protein
VGSSIAAFLTHAARVAFAAGAMLGVGGLLWLAIGVITALAGIQTGTVVLVSTALIALAGIGAGSYISVRYITPNSLVHPTAGAVALALLFVLVTMHGDVGSYRVVAPVGAGAIALISAFITRSFKAPPNKSLERTRDR